MSLGAHDWSVSAAPGENFPWRENDAPRTMVATETLADLVWEPVPDWAYIGQVFHVRLVARMNTEADQTVAAIDVALQWDANYLRLLGVNDDGPYSWLSSGFPDDSAQDGLNDTFLDGDAFYQAWSNFGDPAVATPQGLHVTTFLFEALQETESAQIGIEESLGLSTESHVYGGDFLWQDVTGQLGTVSLRVCPGQPGDDDGDGIENCFDLCPGTPPGEPINADGCGCSQLDCDDGQYCNGAEGCADGICHPGEPPTCNDGIECTADWCDPAANEGTGACVNDPEPAGTPCGDTTDTECDDPDTCDGAGTCLDNYLLPGATCGDFTDDDCTDPDTCDGSGACLDNHELDGTACPDELFCNGEETCDGAGTCQPGVDPCLDPSLPFCNEDTDECVECLEIGDMNGDGYVDLQDFATFQGCETGPVGPVDSPAYSQECQCLDANDDGDVDLIDYGVFQRHFTGP